MQVEINLDLMVEQDVRTGNWIAYIKQFPQAIGAGKDKEEAQSHWLEIFNVMLEEREYDIKQQIVEKYMGHIEFDNLKISA